MLVVRANWWGCACCLAAETSQFAAFSLSLSIALLLSQRVSGNGGVDTHSVVVFRAIQQPNQLKRWRTGCHTAGVASSVWRIERRCAVIDRSYSSLAVLDEGSVESALRLEFAAPTVGITQYIVRFFSGRHTLFGQQPTASASSRAAVRHKQGKRSGTHLQIHSKII